MVNATPVHRNAAGTSLTKASCRRGMQPMLQQCQCVSLWVQKHTVAGCLA